MLPRALWLVGLLALGVNSASTDSSTSDASSDSSASESRTSTSSASIVTLTGSEISSTSFTGSYQSIGSQVTASDLYTTASSTSSSKSGSQTGTGSDGSSSTTEKPGTTSTATLIVGGGGLVTESIINGTVTLSSHLNTTTTKSSGTGTSTSAAATNTQACNNYPEFCDRKYSNITEVCAHNSAFVKKGNAASNQELGITTQLNDGIRMIQGETHYVNGSIYSCHTSCDILNAGTYLSELETVADWVRDHPYDVVTILIVNSDYVNVGNYSPIFQQSGLAPYLYEPPYIPMRLDQWPTLSDMILSQKRVVVFMDYQADQSEVPYILDEFTHMWETPFSPTNNSFPCTTQRPPNLNQTVAKDELMYLANHNLDTDVSIFGTSLLIPNTAELNITNAAGDQLGMLGATNNNCTEKWDRPPNFLLVDFYDVGSGSVFEVAAKANNVTYTRSCCGSSSSGAADLKSSAAALMFALVAALAFVF